MGNHSYPSSNFELIFILFLLTDFWVSGTMNSYTGLLITFFRMTSANILNFTVVSVFLYAHLWIFCYFNKNIIFKINWLLNSDETFLMWIVFYFSPYSPYFLRRPALVASPRDEITWALRTIDRRQTFATVAILQLWCCLAIADGGLKKCKSNLAPILDFVLTLWCALKRCSERTGKYEAKESFS